MITQAELNIVLVEINKILDKLTKRIEALEQQSSKAKSKTKA